MDEINEADGKSVDEHDEALAQETLEEKRFADGEEAAKDEKLYGEDEELPPEESLTSEEEEEKVD